MERIILHVDMDAFFASVEQLDDKSLRGKPVIVGGVSARGVVSTCSYEARKYGVHSAMPAFMAQKLCPHGIFLSGRYWRYKEVSEQVFTILMEVTNLIEPMSIDEAYLDITNSKYKDGLEAAYYIKKEVLKRIGLTLSIGISYNKFLAKIASDMNKPNGITIIKEEDVQRVLAPMSISKIHGLGKKSVGKLNNMGFFKIQDLYSVPLDLFVEHLGKYGIEIYNRIRGIDNRELVIHRDRKSYGKERTLKSDTRDIDELLTYIEGFAEEISKGLQRRNIKGKTITVKYKTASFINHTRSRTILYYTNDPIEVYNVCKEILEDEELDEDIRLIGVSVSSFQEPKIEQLSLF